MRFITALVLFSSIFLSCNPSGKIGSGNTSEGSATASRPLYNASATRSFDLIHTKLQVSFDWEQQHLFGNANLTLKPYFYSSDELILDAKGFDIEEVNLITNGEPKSLKYIYQDKLKINIDLGKKYTRNDTIEIQIAYTAKPNELTKGGSAAITSDIGLYFIDPKGEDDSKPTQLWTQGETESSSCWFPTIDKPNERCTQEIYITVEDKYQTLSNGVMVSSTPNADGTRTDYWNQTIPHAPYLFMMTVGEFSIYKDKWKDLDVWYYMDPEYGRYAKNIFGNTPEMMTFYSELLGVEYPWEKYHQVVVEDFVSGAMENTTAVTYYDGLEQTDRERIDYDMEDIIAHELIHHWFGDLVTCESWANLPLNESFATYGEALWIEYKYGQEEADFHLYRDTRAYMMESNGKKVDLIRFDYMDKEDMFDAHSYQKGGQVLRMLRHYVGDDAFFTSLNKYLVDNAYSDVEIHELRIAFEEVTGEDLNWFFNQWFLGSGHPTLNIDYEYGSNSSSVTISQVQNLEKHPLYKLPLLIDIYINGKVDHHLVTLESQKETFTFTTAGVPDLINVDAKRSLLCEKNDNNTVEAWVHQYKHAPLLMDRYEAISNLDQHQNDNEYAKKVMYDALNDPFHAIRRYAIRNYVFDKKLSEEDVTVLTKLALKDPKSNVRSVALDKLTYFKDEAFMPIFEQALLDSSYWVLAQALESISVINPKLGYENVKALESIENNSVGSSIASIYASSGTMSDNQFFMERLEKNSGYGRYQYIQYYGRFLKRLRYEDESAEGVKRLSEIAKNDPSEWNEAASLGALVELKEAYMEDLKTLEKSGADDILERKKLNHAQEMLIIIGENLN